MVVGTEIEEADANAVWGGGRSWTLLVASLLRILRKTAPCGTFLNPKGDCLAFTQAWPKFWWCALCALGPTLCECKTSQHNAHRVAVALPTRLRSCSPRWWAAMVWAPRHDEARATIKVHYTTLTLELAKAHNAHHQSLGPKPSPCGPCVRHGSVHRWRQLIKLSRHRILRKGHPADVVADD